MKTDNETEQISEPSLRQSEFLITTEDYYKVEKFMGRIVPENYAAPFSVVTTWDYWMVVIEKIAENYDFTIQFYDGNCNCYCTKQNFEESDITGVGHGGFKPNIQNVSKSVVAFIDWYNTSQTLKK